MSRYGLTVLVLVLIIVSSGCVPIRGKGTTHYLVFGIGVVSVGSTNREVADVSRANTVGFLASKNGVKLGYASELTIAVKTNENVVVEASKYPFGPFKVEVPRWSNGYVVETKQLNPTNVCAP